ncbi:ribonuclease K3-like [Octodon degus]|uniref:Ribonuclease K6 n=1 Tax=Octodon degus TaxID=10160 RepID=A0A6P3VE83_OCTDE|nr:ribonuclease K3-like [Octodon degus]
MKLTRSPEVLVSEEQRSPLLLLLGLLGLVRSCSAQTPFKKFEVQHVQPNSLPCDQAMISVNKAAQKCTPTHTFLHKAPQDVIAICRLPTTPCRSGQNKCHLSACPVRMTECQLIGKDQFPNCRYTDTHRVQNFIVACDPRQPGDPRDPLLPVYLD